MDIKSRREILQIFAKDCGVSPPELDEIANDESFWAEVDRRVAIERDIAAFTRSETRSTASAWI